MILDLHRCFHAIVIISVFWSFSASVAAAAGFFDNWRVYVGLLSSTSKSEFLELGATSTILGCQLISNVRDMVSTNVDLVFIDPVYAEKTTCSYLVDPNGSGLTILDGFLRQASLIPSASPITGIVCRYQVDMSAEFYILGTNELTAIVLKTMLSMLACSVQLFTPSTIHSTIFPLASFTHLPKTQTAMAAFGEKRCTSQSIMPGIDFSLFTTPEQLERLISVLNFAPLTGDSTPSELILVAKPPWLTYNKVDTCNSTTPMVKLLLQLDSVAARKAFIDLVKKVHAQTTCAVSQDQTVHTFNHGQASEMLGSLQSDSLVTTYLAKIQSVSLAYTRQFAALNTDPTLTMAIILEDVGHSSSTSADSGSLWNAERIYLVRQLTSHIFLEAHLLAQFPEGLLNDATCALAINNKVHDFTSCEVASEEFGETLLYFFCTTFPATISILNTDCCLEASFKELTDYLLIELPGVTKDFVYRLVLLLDLYIFGKHQSLFKHYKLIEQAKFWKSPLIDKLGESQKHDQNTFGICFVLHIKNCIKSHPPNTVVNLIAEIRAVMVFLVGMAGYLNASYDRIHYLVVNPNPSDKNSEFEICDFHYIPSIYHQYIQLKRGLTLYEPFKDFCCAETKPASSSDWNVYCLTEVPDQYRQFGSCNVFEAVKPIRRPDYLESTNSLLIFNDTTFMANILTENCVILQVILFPPEGDAIFDEFVSLCLKDFQSNHPIISRSIIGFQIVKSNLKTEIRFWVVHESAKQLKKIFSELRQHFPKHLQNRSFNKLPLYNPPHLVTLSNELECDFSWNVYLIQTSNLSPETQTLLFTLNSVDALHMLTMIDDPWTYSEHYKLDIRQNSLISRSAQKHAQAEFYSPKYIKLQTFEMANLVEFLKLFMMARRLFPIYQVTMKSSGAYFYYSSDEIEAQRFMLEALHAVTFFSQAFAPINDAYAIPKRSFIKVTVAEENHARCPKKNAILSQDLFHFYFDENHTFESVVNSAKYVVTMSLIAIQSSEDQMLQLLAKDFFGNILEAREQTTDHNKHQVLARKNRLFKWLPQFQCLSVAKSFADVKIFWEFKKSANFDSAEVVKLTETLCLYFLGQGFTYGCIDAVEYLESGQRLLITQRNLHYKRKLIMNYKPSFARNNFHPDTRCWFYKFQLNDSPKQVDSDKPIDVFMYGYI